VLYKPQNHSKSVKGRHNKVYIKYSELENGQKLLLLLVLLYVHGLATNRNVVSKKNRRT